MKKRKTYRQIIEEAKRDSNQPFPDSILSTTDEKINRYQITIYLEKNHSKLNNSNSFESVLLAKLLESDKGYQQKWKYYESKPIRYLCQGITFHGTKIKPSIIFSQGLKANYHYKDQEQYTKSMTGGIGVSTTTAFYIAEHYAFPRQHPPCCSMGLFDNIDYSAPGYIYYLDVSALQENTGIDINETHRIRGQSLDDKTEINFTQDIPSSAIIGAMCLKESDPLPQWKKNSSYTRTYDIQYLQKLVHHNISITTPMPALPTENKIIENRISMIKQLIEKKIRGHGWHLGVGNSLATIVMDGKKYPVPRGIQNIYKKISHANTYDPQLMQEIQNIAQKGIYHHTFLFFGRRSSNTRFFYQKILNIIYNENSKPDSAINPSSSNLCPTA